MDDLEAWESVRNDLVDALGNLSQAMSDLSAIGKEHIAENLREQYEAIERFRDLASGYAEDGRQ